MPNDSLVLDKIRYQRNAVWSAESRYCFIETDIAAADDPSRTW